MASEIRAGRTVVGLDDPRAADPALTGVKAANLAIARRAGLPVLDGFVLTVAPHGAAETDGAVRAESAVALREPWRACSASGTRPLVVRSSSTIEDAEDTSMAGRFRSVLGVRSWEAFLAAVAEVLRSAAAAGPVAPMAVLVQPQLTAVCGGVMFGVDPVSGDRGRVVVEAVAGGPDALVSGRVSAQRYVLSRRGRLRSADPGPGRGRRLLGGRRLRALAGLGRRAEEVYEGPQDVEWAIDDGGRLWLLQSRPVTATGDAVEASGPVLGPGPVAETFPLPLRPLETDLWVAPLRTGIAAALGDTYAVSRRRLRESPVVSVVDGRVAADLELFGYVVGRGRAPLRVLDPRPGLRRLSAAWRIGKLRQALPDHAAELVADVDARLAAVPSLRRLSDRDLVAHLESGRETLAILHREEVLAGTLIPNRPPTAAAVALTALLTARARELRDAETIRRHPVVLALVPPQVRRPTPLPAPSTPAALVRDVRREMSPRESVRLRARWVQELTARAALELGRRLTERELLPGSESVALLLLDELREVVAGGDPPDDLAERARAHEERRRHAPLPSLFRLSPAGEIVAAARPGARPAGGVGAGGGRGTGPVAHREGGAPGRGSVLVVGDLSPELAVLLPGLAGLVAESGSTLSHLAILAREYGIPTVVAVHDARHRFPPGTRLLVDGTTGEVTTLDPSEDPP